MASTFRSFAISGNDLCDPFYCIVEVRVITRSGIARARSVIS